MPVLDLRYINRKIPIIEVAGALDLRPGDNGNLHCWRPHLHQHGDRTASVGIRKSNNTVKCFGCQIGPLGPVDLVITVLGLKDARTAAQWIAQRFDVPVLPVGKHLVQPERRICPVGFESDLGLLIRSGLWARLSGAAQSLVPVLLELAERNPATQTLSLTISYIGLARYSGTTSPKAIAKTLRELQEIGWLLKKTGAREPGSGPVRTASAYLLTPRSEEIVELAHANFAQAHDDIEMQRTLRAEARAKRKQLAITK
jgi:DNA-binding HxlR family transcriptional regulator